MVTNSSEGWFSLYYRYLFRLSFEVETCITPICVPFATLKAILLGTFYILINYSHTHYTSLLIGPVHYIAE